MFIVHRSYALSLPLLKTLLLEWTDFSLPALPGWRATALWVFNHRLGLWEEGEGWNWLYTMEK